MASTALRRDQSNLGDQRELALTWLKTAASHSPSGGNARPWLYELLSSYPSTKVRLSINPRYALQRSPMDLDGSASVVALGCYAQTLKRLAELNQYEVSSIDFAVGVSHWQSSVEIEFKFGHEVAAEYDLGTIKQRKTTRRPFAQGQLSDEVEAALVAVAVRAKSIQFRKLPIADNDFVKLLVQLDHVRWLNERLMTGLLDEINFESRDLKPEHGISIRDLGVGFIDQKLMGTLKNSSLMRSLFRMGFYRKASWQSVGRLVQASSFAFMLQVERNDFASIFTLGFSYQDLWLKVTKLGLNFQPVSGFLLAYNYWSDTQSNFYNPWQVERIQTVSSAMTQNYQLDLKKYALGFRLG